MARTCTSQLVAKRRSSTRVGRKHPAPSALARAAEALRPSPVPSDYSPPFLVDGLICRLMTPPNAQPEVQQWAGAYWQPSLIPMYRLSSRTPVSRALLAAQFVPIADWIGHPPRRWERPRLRKLDRATFDAAVMTGLTSDLTTDRVDGPMAARTPHPSSDPSRV